MLICRQALVKDRTAAKGGETTLTVGILQGQNASRSKQIDHQVGALDDEIAARIVEELDLVARNAILLSIRGFVEVTVATLGIEMPELGTFDPGEAASFFWDWRRKNTRHASRRAEPSFRAAGRKYAKSFMVPAEVATRFNPDLKAKYDQLVATGEPRKVGITAVI